MKANNANVWGIEPILLARKPWLGAPYGSILFVCYERSCKPPKWRLVVRTLRGFQTIDDHGRRKWIAPHDVVAARFYALVNTSTGDAYDWRDERSIDVVRPRAES